MMERNSFRLMVPSSHKGTAEKEEHRSMQPLAGKADRQLQRGMPITESGDPET